LKVINHTIMTSYNLSVSSKKIPSGVFFFLFILNANTVSSSPIWPSSLGIMQSNSIGSTSPVDILYSISSPSGGGGGSPQGTTTLIGITSSELSVVLFQALDNDSNQQTQLGVYKNDQNLWKQLIGVDCLYKETCNVSIAFDDEVIYATTLVRSGDGEEKQVGCFIFNISTGIVLTSQQTFNLPVFPGYTLPVITSSSDAVVGQFSPLVWITSLNVVFVGTFVDNIGINGTNTTLPVSISDSGCAFTHKDMAVCTLISGGLVVLQATLPNSPSILWTNYVKPFFIAKDFGTSGMLVVDTDIGGFTGGSFAGLDLKTGATLWTWQKPPKIVYTAFAYNGASTMMLKSFFFNGADFSVGFDTFTVSNTKLESVSSASIPSFPPSSLPFNDFLSFDSNGVTAYTCNNLGEDTVMLAVTSGMNGVGAITTLGTDEHLRASSLIIAGPKPTQITVQYDDYTINVLM
jgi:hypothetical protein